MIKLLTNSNKKARLNYQKAVEVIAQAKKRNKRHKRKERQKERKKQKVSHTEDTPGTTEQKGKQANETKGENVNKNVNSEEIDLDAASGDENNALETGKKQ